MERDAGLAGFCTVGGSLLAVAAPLSLPCLSLSFPPFVFLLRSGVGGLLLTDLTVQEAW